MFTEVLDFAVESSNSSGYDQVIDHVTLTIRGVVTPDGHSSVPEPSTMTSSVPVSVPCSSSFAVGDGRGEKCRPLRLLITRWREMQ
jgi:hypothetical protein